MVMLHHDLKNSSTRMGQDGSLFPTKNLTETASKRMFQAMATKSMWSCHVYHPPNHHIDRLYKSNHGRFSWVFHIKNKVHLTEKSPMSLPVTKTPGSQSRHDGLRMLCKEPDCRLVTAVWVEPANRQDDCQEA